MERLSSPFSYSSRCWERHKWRRHKAASKINSLSEVTDKAKEGADTILDVAKYILAAVLGIALVFVIYSLATNNPHAKEYLLGWIIAVVVIMVAFPDYLKTKSHENHA
ncbi:hypothetical protein NIB75_11125 [Bacteroides uniformis]|nr:hypothetical protein [Bacteroides uniformis]